MCRERIIELKILRQRRKRRLWRKRRNRIKFISKPSDSSCVGTKQSLPMVFPPMVFSIDNLEESLAFINKTYEYSKILAGRRLFVWLKDIKKIDMFMICLLLSLLNKLSGNHVGCWGNYPIDTDVRSYLINSGFLNIIQSNIKNASEKMFENQMYMIGKDTVNSSLIGNSVKIAMEQLMGVKTHYPPVYDNMIEICSNSVEHSNRSDSSKNWLVSISKNEDTLSFILTDTGVGILQTLKKKKSEMFTDKLFKNDGKVLKGVFNKKYCSCTGEINRHKGLPIVYESFLDGFISNLMVLTNCVLYDFVRDSYEILNNEFKGVMYCWTIDKNNYTKWKETV